MGSAILQYLMKKVYHKNFQHHYNYKSAQQGDRTGFLQVTKTMEAKDINSHNIYSYDYYSYVHHNVIVRPRARARSP